MFNFYGCSQVSRNAQAQSIGEPATQMTLKTFHFAGVAGSSGFMLVGLKSEGLRLGLGGSGEKGPCAVAVAAVWKPVLSTIGC